MKTKLCLSVLIIVVSSMIGFSQDTAAIPFQVNINYPPLSISQDHMNKANNLSELNRMFKTEWVREYLWVEISSIQNGKVIKVLGDNNIITQEQKDFLKRINFPASITVKVHYVPENTLKQNDPREENFTFSIHPTKSAAFIGGNKKLKNYLKENAINKIPNTIFQGYDLAVIKFTINELGQVIDASVFQSSKDETTDALLYEAVCNMPDWKPAEYDNGNKVIQEFAFTIGNHESCVINLLNTVNNMY